MKAIQFARFGGAEVLDYVELPRPSPQTDEVLIEVTAAGVNFPDIRERMGVYQRAETHVGGVVLPRVSGLQAVGRVVEVGAKSDHRLIGKKVVALLPGGGGYAQLVIAPSNLIVVLPESADDVTMAALPDQGVTAYLTLTASTKVQPGESLLVHGAAGGVGSLAVQIAKALGARLVIATAGSDERRAYTLSIGADVAVDYAKPDWPNAVLEATDGRGVDIILESIGGDIFEQNFECLATFGRCIIFGSTRGPGAPFAPRRLMTKCQTMTGIYVPVFFAQRPDLVHEALAFLVAHTLDGTVRPNVATVLGLSQTVEAHRMLEERRAVGVVVLDPRR
jgi:NADPH2:quinone reductase